MKRYLYLLVCVWLVSVSMGTVVKAADDATQIVDTSNHTYTYSEMVEDLVQLAQRYPGRISLSSIGMTADQRPIYQVVLGNPNAPKAVYIQSTIHAREWMNTMMVMKQLETNLMNWDVPINGVDTYGSLFQKCAVYIVPMVNPDGVTISQYGIDGIISPELRASLKNMKGANKPDKWKANANGVDLNRNFSVGWEEYNSKVTSPASQGYKGASPFSENETIAVAQAMTQRKFEAIISYHSYEGAIYWNIGQDEPLLYANFCLAQYISGITGYEMVNSSSVHGLDYNWAIYEAKVPALLIETGTVACPLPYSQWESLWLSNKDVMSSLALVYK